MCALFSLQHLTLSSHLVSTAALIASRPQTPFISFHKTCTFNPSVSRYPPRPSAVVGGVLQPSFSQLSWQRKRQRTQTNWSASGWWNKITCHYLSLVSPFAVLLYLAEESLTASILLQHYKFIFLPFPFFVFVFCFSSDAYCILALDV